MGRKKLDTDNWVLPDKDGNHHRFTTYASAWDAKRKRPEEFSSMEDVMYLPRSSAA